MVLELEKSKRDRKEITNVRVCKKRGQNYFRSRHQMKLGPLESRIMGGKCDS
jgi:hypothetical protein